jgi:hypothetical protein
MVKLRRGDHHLRNNAVCPYLIRIECIESVGSTDIYPSVRSLEYGVADELVALQTVTGREDLLYSSGRILAHESVCGGDPEHLLVLHDTAYV